MIESAIASGKKITLSCSAISTKYKTNILHRSQELLCGVVVSKGKIYFSAPSDVHSRSIKHIVYRYTYSNYSCPPEIAVMMTPAYNEFLIQDYKIGGIFWQRGVKKEGFVLKNDIGFSTFLLKYTHLKSDIGNKSKLLLFKLIKKAFFILILYSFSCFKWLVSGKMIINFFPYSVSLLQS